MTNQIKNYLLYENEEWSKIPYEVIITIWDHDIDVKFLTIRQMLTENPQNVIR